MKMAFPSKLAGIQQPPSPPVPLSPPAEAEGGVEGAVEKFAPDFSPGIAASHRTSPLSPSAGGEKGGWGIEGAKRIAFLFMLFFGVIGNLLAQPVSKDAYDCPEFLIPRKEKASNLYGYVDIGGNYIIPPTYLQAGYFQGKNARVQMGKKFGVINCQGRLVVPATFDVIDDFVNGFGWVQQNGKWGLMRSDGQLEVPLAFDSVNAVSRRSGFTWVYKDSLWGIFDKDTRKMVIKPSYKMYRGVTDSLIIGRYDAWFDIVDLKKQLAIIDSATQIVRLTPNVIGYKKRHWGIVDVRGRIELPPQADTLLTDGNNIIVWQNGRPSLHSRFGKSVPVKFPVDSLALTGSPLVRYRTKTGQGLLNGGRKVFANEYDQVIGPLGRYALLKKGKWFLYKQGSKKVDATAYDSVQVLNGGRYFALYAQRTAAVYSSVAGQVFMPGTVAFIMNDTGVVVRCAFSGGSNGLLNLKNGTLIWPGPSGASLAMQRPSWLRKPNSITSRS